MFQEEDEEQDGIWKKLLELFECNGIKQQFEKQVSKVGIKICGENRGKKKNIEKIGEGERAMSDEKVLYRMKKLKFTRGILVKIHEN